MLYVVQPAVKVLSDGQRSQPNHFDLPHDDDNPLPSPLDPHIATAPGRSPIDGGG